jgi:hypothetical protein
VELHLSACFSVASDPRSRTCVPMYISVQDFVDWKGDAERKEEGGVTQIFQGRLRINGVGIADVIHFDPSKIVLQQLDDLVRLFCCFCWSFLVLFQSCFFFFFSLLFVSFSSFLVIRFLWES